jgi:histidinol phosphatase-like enzyme
MTGSGRQVPVKNRQGDGREVFTSKRLSAGG